MCRPILIFSSAWCSPRPWCSRCSTPHGPAEEDRLTEATAMNAFQLLIGLCSGLIVGTAVFSHPISRAVVIGLIAGVVIGGIVIDGVEGYVNWAAYIPAE